MSDSGNVTPITDEQAKAIQEAIKALRGLGGFLREAVGTVPEDLVGYLGGDWLKVRRRENLVRLLERFRERLNARKTKIKEPISLSVALPLFRAAADESRDELQDLWARLLAAAADPSRASHFRQAFIETAKRMDPLDAAVLSSLQGQQGGGVSSTGLNGLAVELGVSRDQIEVSCGNLKKLELVGGSQNSSFLLPFGREFLRAVSD
jgi:hypothetical protein